MFRGEKNTNWEGGYRVPSLIRWPGVIKPGTVINDIGAHEDMLPTLLAAAGDTTVKEDLLKGRAVGGTTYKVHLDGYNLLPALKGEARVAAQGVHLLDRRRQRRRAALRPLEGHLPAAERPRPARLDGAVRGAARPDAHQPAHRPVRARRVRGHGYNQWFAEHMFLIAPAGAYVGQWLQSFQEFPPRQKPGSFNLDRVMEAVTEQRAASSDAGSP